MTILLIFAVLIVLASAFVFYLLLGGLSQPKDLTILVNSLKPVNPRSLAQLVSGPDDDLLKRKLPPRKYQALRRQKLCVLRSYYRVALKNCSVLQACGEAIQRGEDVEARDFGGQLAAAALMLRVRLLRALTVTQISVWIPGIEPNIAKISMTYATTVEELRASSQSKPLRVRQLVDQAFSS